MRLWVASERMRSKCSRAEAWTLRSVDAVLAASFGASLAGLGLACRLSSISVAKK